MAEARMSIHPTAIIEAGAELGADVEIGPFCHVGASVKLHDGVVLKSHVVIDGATQIGARTIIYPFAAIGAPPQHLGYKGEATKLIIGADNIIREHVTMNNGTVAGRGVTQIGNSGFFMIGAHVAHDCIIGDNAIFANNASIAGHVEVGDGVFLGALCGVHQQCRIGSYAFIGGCAAVTGDIIPYASATGNHARLAGLNFIGLKRRGLPRDVIRNLRNAYKMLFADEDTFKERFVRVREQYADCPEVMNIVEFIGSDAPRSLMTPRR